MCGVAAGVWGQAVPAEAAVVFSNGFESGNTSDWDYELNPEGLSVVTAPEPVLAGTYALKAELTSETVWSNGIFRTEVQHKPDEARVAEGAELFFGWSIYLPKALPAGDYQLGYFETRNTYEQIFSLHAEGTGLALYVNRLARESPSSHPGVLEPGKWHRIVYHVKWSTDRNIGFVSLWFNGVKLVNQMHGETNFEDPALVQLGLLKNPPEPPEPVVLYVDEVMEGDSYADVSLGIAEVDPNAPPAPTEVSPTTAAPTTAAPTTTAPTTATPAPTATDPTATGPATAAPAESKNSGCSVSLSSGGTGGVSGWLSGASLLFLGLAAWLRRPRRGAR